MVLAILLKTPFLKACAPAIAILHTGRGVQSGEAAGVVRVRGKSTVRLESGCSVVVALTIDSIECGGDN